jgi:hypothetical protein
MTAWISLFTVASLNLLAAGWASTANPLPGITVQGPGAAPHLVFACCDHGIEAMQSLFADSGVARGLVELHAEVAVAITDFSPQRAMLVHQLNEKAVPTIAWIVLPQEQGLYLNADNALQVVARVRAFERWTDANGLKWAAVGLDIEPNFTELTRLENHRWHLVTTLFWRAVKGGHLVSARQTYLAMIAELQSRGYLVQTYQMPYLPAERSAHSTLLDRMLGTVDVRGNTEYLMLYTSYARLVGAGMIWQNGGSAQAIAIGSTDGNGPSGAGTGPLSWDEFSRDLIVASHFTHQIGVYNLEGCVRQGFLGRLETMDWHESVTIPPGLVSNAQRFGFLLRTSLWIAANSLYFAILLLFGGTAFLWRTRAKKNRFIVPQRKTSR